MDQPAARTPNQSRSPSSLPGRDPTADADTSLIRKRPRLSHEQETPPAINDDSSNSATLSDFQGSSAHSPPVVEVSEMEATDSPAVSIIMSGDENPDFGCIDDFPFRSNQFPTPELAAGAFAEILRHPHEPVEDKDLLKLFDWLDKHLSATEENFNAALQDAPGSHASNIYHVYSDHTNFWNNVVACFAGLAGRSSFNQRSEYCGEIGSIFFESLLESFLKLGERLMKTEVVILSQANARRDSTRPVDLPKHTLLFVSWISVFHGLIARDRSFLKRAYSTLKLKGESIRKGIILRFQTCAMGILVDLLTQIVNKPGTIQFPFLTVHFELCLLRDVFAGTGNIEDNLLRGLYQQSLRLYRVIQTVALECVPKIHPDDLPPQFHIDIGVVLSETLQLLLMSDYLSPSSAFEMTMKDVSEYKIHPEDIIVHSLDEQHNTPEANGHEDVTKEALNRDNVSSGVNASRMEYYNALAKSNIVELRVMGIDSLGRLVYEIWASRVPDMSEHSSRFIHANGIVSHIFGPQSHAAVISRSYNIVGFLATTRTMTRTDADALWNTVVKYQQSDIAQHAGIVFFQALPNMDSAQLMYFCEKFSSLDSSQYSRQTEKMLEVLLSLLPKSIGFNHTHCYKAARICINLLGTVGSSSVILAAQDSQIVSLKKMLRALPSSDNIEEQFNLVDICAGPIKSRSELATGCIQALFCILCMQNNTIVTAQGVLSRLSFQESAEEMIHFVQSAKLSNEKVAANALTCRVDLVMYLLSISDPAATISTERRVWDHLVGEGAISPEAREIAWAAIASNLERLSIGLSEFYQRCISQYLPELSPDLITLGTYALFSIEGKRQEPHPDVLVPLKQDLIRFAVLCPSNQISHQLISAILSQLFDGKAFAVPSVAIPEQIDLVRKCVDLLSLRDISSSRAASLLRFAVTCSIRYEANLGQRKKATTDQDDNASISQPEPDKMQIPLRIHLGNADPKNHVLTVNKSASCSELNAAITSEIGSENYLAISSGRTMNFINEPQQPIQTLGLEDGKTLIVRKHSTLQSVADDALKNNSKTAVARELLLHLDALHNALDELNSTGDFAYQVLQILGFPGPIRSLIISSDTPFDTIFPSAKPWLMRLSIEVIYKQLQEQIAVGLADEDFLRRAIHLLIDLLDRDECTQRFFIVQRAADVLLALLRERPVKDNPEAYFKNPERFVNRTLSIVSLLNQQTSDLDSVDPYVHAVHTLYLCLLEGVLLSPSLRAVFPSANGIAEVHQTLLMTGNSHLSLKMNNSIVGALRDSRMSTEIKSFFWTMFIEKLIPAAQERPTLCKGVYDIAPEIFAVNQDLVRDEQMLRELIEYYSKFSLEMKHLECQGSSFVDYRVQGLTELLRYSIEALKYLKKPLNLRNLASRLFSRLLFPQESAAHPVVNVTTRRVLYQLIQTMCDDLDVLTELSSLCERVGHIDVPNEWTFPGPDQFVRSTCGYAGLDNLAQTCYMNSLIQQLFMNINFRKFILDTPIVQAKDQSILYEFKKAFSHMQNSHGPTYHPEDLAKALDVDVMVQDDAHIFFTTLIGKLEDSMPDEDAKKALKAFFGGVNKSQTIGSCKHVSESHDEYFNLSLVVKDKASLAESLDEYTQGAALEGGDKFKCTTCGSGEGTYVDAVRRTALDHIPDNLVLGLKRFRYETYDGGTKVNDQFDFPERIDMSPYKLQRLAGVDEQDEPDVFQLVGVVVHSGTLQFGHYWSYAAERGYAGPGPVPWFRLEDSIVTRSSIEEVIRETSGGPLDKSPSESSMLRADNAYVLFYQRVTSLEDSLKCVVSDPAPTAATTHPKVSLPQEMAANIACDNAKHIHLLNLFSIDHLNFVLDLAARSEDLKDSDASRTKAVEKNILELLFWHYVSVFSRSPATNLIDHTALMIQKLVCLRPEYAAWTLDNMFIDMPFTRFIREHIIMNKKPTVRKATARLVLACLEHLRKAAPNQYITATDESMTDTIYNSRIGQVLYGLQNMLNLLPEHRTVWPEYFDLVGQIADFGLRETDVVLALGFLEWCIDVMIIQWDINIQKQNELLWFQLQNNRRYSIGSVVECIYMLLHKHVDLHGSPLKSTQIGESRMTNSGTLLLSATETSGLVWSCDKGSGYFMRSCMANSARPKSELWSDWGICKLAVILTDTNKAGLDISTPAYHAILSFIPFSCGPHAEVVASILLAKRLDGTAKGRLIEAMVSTMNASRLRDSPEVAKAFTRILNMVYPSHPALMLRNLVPLVESLVMCECDEAEKETAKWLRSQVLVQASLSKPYGLRNIRLFHQRFKVVKHLTYNLGELLKGPAQSGYDYNLYEAAIDGFKDCSSFMTQTLDNAKEDMADWLMRDGMEPDAESEKAFDELIEDVGDELESSDLITFAEEGLEMLEEWAKLESNRLAFRQNIGRSEVEDETDAELIDSEDDGAGGEFDEMTTL